MLVDRQIDGQCPHARPVAGPSRGLGRRKCLGLAPARTAQCQHLVLGDMGPHRRQLEDLAGLDVDDLGTTEITITVPTTIGSMDDDLVGIGHLGQMMTLVAGLLAGSPLRRSTLRSVGRRLGQTLCRGRHRGVARGPRQAPLELGDLGFERSDRLAQPGVLGTKPFDLSGLCLVVLVHLHKSNRTAPQSRALPRRKRAGRARFCKLVLGGSAHAGGNAPTRSFART